MAPNLPSPDAALPGTGGPSDLLSDLEPEMAEGPLGLPYLKPSGAPDLPDGPDAPGGLGDMPP
jgi:hypothetical protein